MARKKKFKTDFLEEALKPDLLFMVKEAEAEFTLVARRIFEGVEIEKEPKTNIAAIFKDKEIKQEKPVADDAFLTLLAEAQKEAAAVAANIFK